MDGPITVRAVEQFELTAMLSVPAPWTGLFIGSVLFALVPRRDNAARVESAFENEQRFDTHPPHNCPVCGWLKNSVIDKRDRPNCIRRLRECGNCHARWSTREYTHRIVRTGDGTEAVPVELPGTPDEPRRDT